MRFLLLLFFFPATLFSQNTKRAVDLYFGSGSFELSESESQKLELIFNDPGMRINTVSVTGYCDDIGTAISNTVLSKKRAASVSLLLEKDFHFRSNPPTGKGEVQLNSLSDTEGQRAHNRRATLEITYSEVTETMETKPAADLKMEGEGYKTFNDTLEVGDKIIIPHLLFIGSRTAFSDPELTEGTLLSIVKFMKENPNIAFEIQGHVCCITNSFKDARDIDTGINNLSKARAQKVYDYFIEKGIPKERMSHEGYGRRFPRKNIPETLNKRVEIVITKV